MKNREPNLKKPVCSAVHKVAAGETLYRIARRYGVDYAIRKVDGDKPRVLVFFKARDSDALTAALKELASTKARTQSERPSVLQRLEKAKEQATKTIGKIRNREPSR